VIENPGIHNVYFSNTVTFTLAHIREHKHQEQILLQRSKKWNMYNLTVYETSEKPIWRTKSFMCPSNANNIWIFSIPLNSNIKANCSFQTKRSCILPTHCIYVIRAVLTKNSDNFLVRRSSIVLFNWSTMNSLWGRNWIFIYNAG